jgi:hypothetical protein
MPSKEWNTADKIHTALTEGFKYLPEKHERSPFGGPSYLLGINVAGKKEGEPIRPFIHYSLKDTLSSHNLIALEMCRSGAEKAANEYKELLENSQGASVWMPEFSFSINPRKELCIYIHGWRHPASEHDKPSSFRGAIEALSFAFKMSKTGPSRKWRYGSRQETFHAADPTSAVLIGCALFFPNQTRSLWQGKTEPLDIIEVHDPVDVVNEIAGRRAEIADLIHIEETPF